MLTRSRGMEEQPGNVTREERVQELGEKIKRYSNCLQLMSVHVKEELRHLRMSLGSPDFS